MSSLEFVSLSLFLVFSLPNSGIANIVLLHALSIVMFAYTFACMHAHYRMCMGKRKMYERILCIY